MLVACPSAAEEQPQQQGGGGQGGLFSSEDKQLTLSLWFTLAFLSRSRIHSSFLPFLAASKSCRCRSDIRAVAREGCGHTRFSQERETGDRGMAWSPLLRSHQHNKMVMWDEWFFTKWLSRLNGVNFLANN